MEGGQKWSDGDKRNRASHTHGMANHSVAAPLHHQDDIENGLKTRSRSNYIKLGKNVNGVEDHGGLGDTNTDYDISPGTGYD